MGSGVATWQAARATQARAETRFREDAAQMSASLQAMLTLYLSLLRGTAGLFISSDHVTPQEFETYVDSLGLGTEVRGVRSLAFIPRVPAEDRLQFEQRASALHGRAIEIWPRTTTPVHFPVMLTAPEDPLKQMTIGFDLTSRPLRREALEESRDAAAPLSTGPIDLVEDQAHRRGFLIATPLYGPGDEPWNMPLGGPSLWPPPQDVEARRRHLKGYIVAAFVMEDVIAAAASTVRVRSIPFLLLDDASPDPVLFQSPGAADADDAAVTEHLEFGGRKWTIHYFNARVQSSWLARAGITPRGAPEARLIPITALLGLGFSIALFLITRTQISARQGAEGEAAEAQRQRILASESERRFRNLADAAPVLIWMTGPDGTLRWVNRAALEFTGLQLQELVGQQWQSIIHPDDLHQSRQAFQAAQNTGRSFASEIRTRRSDGDFRWLLATGRPQLEPAGRFAGFIGTGIDITDQKLAIERLHEQARELEAVNRHLERLNVELARSNLELTDFASLAAHDLKEPLRGMANFARFLREDYSQILPASGRDMVETIERLAGRLTRLLDALMEYARVGRGELRLESVDLNRICDEALEGLTDQLRQPDVVIERRPLPTVRCDPLLLAQVFSNLIANGLKYNTSSPRRIEIGALPASSPPAPTSPSPPLSPRSRDGDIIYIRDNGVGIPAKHHDHIFKMFKRLHPRDAFGGGLGAGLAIVRKIIERHGGRIWIASEVGGPGKGTTFYFTLNPPMNASASESGVRGGEEGGTGGEGGEGGGRAQPPPPQGTTGAARH
jgi:PAS domain S-box-containing protein